MKVNIICAKMGKKKHFEIFNFYLNRISKGHDVCLYIEEQFDFQNPFRKAQLLNKNLNKMRQDFEAVCVFDIDMVYNYRFFDKVEKTIKQGYDYIVSYGKKLAKKETEYLYEKPNFFAVDGMDFCGCSQITMSPFAVQLFTNVFGEPLFDEFYEGWGGEDSDLSFKSKILSSSGLLKKTEFINEWVHLYHEENRPEDYFLRNKNSLYFQKSKENIMKTAKNYVP